MDRLKELQDKVKAGTATDEEKKELAELEANKKEEVEVGEDFKDAVADKVKDGILESIKSDISETIKTAVTSATEKVVKKDIAEGGDDTEEVEQEGENKATESKEIGFMRAAVALVNGNMKTVSEYNAKSISAMKRKAGYGNITTDADGAYLVPNPDFDIEVERLEEEYGVSFQFADVRRINGNSVKLNKKSSGFELTETGEKVAITGKKLSIGQVTADLRKFTGIAPATEELNEDSAIDYWAEVTTEFARARAQKADELLFTDSSSGILEIDDTKAQTIGASNSDIDWDDLLNAEVRVPSPSQKNGVWFMHRTVWQTLIQKKATDSGVYLFQPNPSNMTTPWGVKVVPVEVLPVYGDIGSDTGFAVFGDLKHYKIYVKNGIRLDILREGVITDVDSVEFNLATQDGRALRGVVRMLGVAKFPEAFCVLGTGTVS